jgi:hypothetical protein
VVYFGGFFAKLEFSWGFLITFAVLSVIQLKYKKRRIKRDMKRRITRE